MKLNRIINRAAFYLQKKCIVLISYFNHRLYMKFYIPLLLRQGMVIKGCPRYIGANVVFDDMDKISLGDRVVISNDCHFLTHDYSFTTALIAIGKEVKNDIALVRGISVGNNVFIGKKTIIMPNTKIGNNVIIGAGSVVRGIVEDDSIIIGNPSTKVFKITDQAAKWEKYLNSEFIRIDK